MRTRHLSLSDRFERSDELTGFLTELECEEHLRFLHTMNPEGFHFCEEKDGRFFPRTAN